MQAKVLLPLITLTSLLVVARCEDVEDHSVSYEDTEDGETPVARKNRFYVCDYPGCSCVGGILESVDCNCKFRSDKRFDFRNVNLPEKNHTLHVSDCKEVELNFQRNKKLLDAVQVSRVGKLTVKSGILENVDSLIMRDVRHLVVENNAFETLTARRVEFDNVYFPEFTEFKPNYILNELKITDSIFESNVFIKIDNLPAKDRRIIISNNSFNEPILWLYSHDITITGNSFMSENLNITVRYVNQLTARNNNQQETNLPDISGAGKQMNVTFKIDTNHSHNMTESEKIWLDSFSYVSTSTMSRQKTFQRESSNDSQCSGEKITDGTKQTLEVVCPDTTSYGSFVKSGGYLALSNIRKERGLKDERNGMVQRAARSGASGTAPSLRILAMIVTTYRLTHFFFRN